MKQLYRIDYEFSSVVEGKRWVYTPAEGFEDAISLGMNYLHHRFEDDQINLVSIEATLIGEYYE